MMTGVEGRLFGPFPALPVPLHDDRSLDLDGLGRLIDRLVARGVAGLSVLGGGGEAAYLTGEERQRVVEFTAARAGKKVVVIAGIVELPTEVAVYEAIRFRELGANALLVAPPLDDALPQVVAHYSAIVRDAALPTLYDHDPKRTRFELTEEDMGKLFVEVALAGIRNGSPRPEDAGDLIRAVGRPIAMFAGQSTDMLSCLEAGGVGTICPLPVILPVTARKLVDEYRAGSPDAARVALSKLFDGTPLITPESGQPTRDGVFHQGVKEALVAVGILKSAQTRNPSGTPSEAWRARVRELGKDLCEL
ncbi:MAG TPA: dihydrodipicolinate synthase family protein [Polyangiaceae bacterium]|nr:dihydrodipicolinate synthase family protein [Polyangiaceae bacterium]